MHIDMFFLLKNYINYLKLNLVLFNCKVEIFVLYRVFLSSWTFISKLSYSVNSRVRYLSRVLMAGFNVHI